MDVGRCASLSCGARSGGLLRGYQRFRHRILYGRVQPARVSAFARQLIETGGMEQVSLGAGGFKGTSIEDEEMVVAE